MPPDEKESRPGDYAETANPTTSHDQATSANQCSAENTTSHHDEAKFDKDYYVLDPLPGLPNKDYGREFDAPPPSAPMDVAQRIESLFLTDSGRTLLYWRGSWMLWQTTHWSELDRAQMRSHVYRTMSRATYQHVTAGGVETKSWNPDMHKVANVMQAMDALAHLALDIDPPSWIADSSVETDAGQMISCANGLLDLRQRSLVGHTPSLFNLVSVPFNYDPDAPPPVNWLEFQNQLWPEDPGSIMLLQEFFGYVLSGRLDMHKLLMLVGPMRAGKGTIARILTTLIGSGNVAGPTLSSLGTNFGLSPLLGKPLAIISDARLGPASSHTVVERLLSITGEDMLTVDRKYREPWNGRLPTRFVMLSNELPKFTDSSGAIATRMLIVPLTKSFLNREDRTIESRLLPEMPGILNWALDGLDRLIAKGQFTVPESSDAATTMMMDLASPVSAFVRERCERGPDKIVDKDSLYLDWKLWAGANGHSAGSKITFGRSLHAAVPGLGRADIPVARGRRVHGFRGIGLLGGSGYPESNLEDPAQPAQHHESASWNTFDGQPHSAQTTSTSAIADTPLAAAQDDVYQAVAQNGRSMSTAQDAQDETHCVSTNGDPGPLVSAAPEHEQPEPANPVHQGFAALRRRHGIEVDEHREDRAITEGTDDGPHRPAWINGRPVDRSAHYKAPGNGGRQRRRR